MSGPFADGQADSNSGDRLNPSSSHPVDQPQQSAQPEAEENLAEETSAQKPDATAASRLTTPHIREMVSPLSMVETAFLASTASLLWLVSYYLSIGPWMRIFFPAPIALVYLRWGHRAAWMSALVAGLLLSVLMGPYLSLLFFIPYGLLGVQLGALWKRGARWVFSISIGTIIATFSFFFRIWLLSTFVGEDLWAYLTNRITDLLEWMLTRLVDFGVLGIGMLGQPNLTVVQLMTVLIVVLSDIVYLFTVHLAAWLLLERLGNPIPEPPEWVQVLLEEEN